MAWMRSRTLIKGRISARSLTLCLSLLLASLAPAMAGELAEFNDSVAALAEPYRNAAAYLRTGNQDLAALELESAIERWQATLKRFAADPPDAYSGDKAWRPTLESIAAGLRTALDLVDAGDGSAAAAELAPIRRTLAELRRRNGVTTFSDRVDAVSGAMERLMAFRRQAIDFTSRDTLRALQAGAAIVAYELGRCGEAAPPRLLQDPAFTRLLDGAEAAVGRLWQAIEQGDARLLQATLGELRSFERLLYLRFG